MAMPIPRITVAVVLLAVVGALAWPPPWLDAQSSSVPSPSLSPERRGIGVLTHLRTDRLDLPPTDERRSLVVTDRAILEHFSFAEVMATLGGQASDPGFSPLLFFRQWWSSQGPPPCLSLRFGFPYDCRLEAGQMALVDDPFSGLPPESGYIPIGLFNRIDLAPADGSDCGEYRIVFARREDPRNRGARLLINFEAVLPNRSPAMGLAGCKPIAEFWQELTAIDDPVQRARLLRRFYFDGLAGFPPVVHHEHYGARLCRKDPCVTGQIRTNERLREPWMLREFRLLPTWGSAPRQFRIVPVTVKDSPFGGLVCCESRGVVTPDLLAAFRHDLVRSVRSLARPDLHDRPGLHDFRHDIDPRFNTGQAIALARGESDLHHRFTTPPPDRSVRDALRAVIVAELTAVGSQLTPEILIGRVQALSCAGCHHTSSGEHNPFAPGLQLESGTSWPNSLGFEHVSELKPEMGRDGPRYRVSETVLAFLPRRKEALRYVLSR